MRSASLTFSTGWTDVCRNSDTASVRDYCNFDRITASFAGYGTGKNLQKSPARLVVISGNWKEGRLLYSLFKALKKHPLTFTHNIDFSPEKVK
jgi:hypothetical protein